MIKTKGKEKKRVKQVVAYQKINYTKPTLKTCVRHRRQGQFVGFHFLIAPLKQATDSTFLISAPKAPKF